MIIDTVDLNSVSETLNKIESLQAVVQKTLKSGRDYDVIPGTNKPTLLKPGAEKINMLFGVSPDYEFLTSIEDFEKEFFNYTIKCTLKKNGQTVAQGVGSCNSKENKYRWKNVKEIDVPAHLDKDSLMIKKDGYGRTLYKIENDDICSVANTILKMGKKRAYIDATLQLAALSEIFTQDIEDMKEFIKSEQMTAITYADACNMLINFGKHKGSKLIDIKEKHPDYVVWYMEKGNDPGIKKAFELLNSKEKKQEPEEVKTDVVKTEDKSIDADLPWGKE